MSITKRVVNRPVTVLVVFVLILSIGSFVASSISIDLYPEINPPVLIVYTNYPGAGPEQVEERVTRIIEGQLSGVSNIKEVTSTSSKDNSTIVLLFDWNINLEESSSEVRDKIEFIKQFLPEEAKTPQIFKLSPTMIPILYIGVSGNRDEDEMYQLSKDIIEPKLEQVPGVSAASTRGVVKPIVRVEVKQNRLDAFGLTMTGAINGLSRKISMQNVNTSGGEIDVGFKEYLVKTGGQFSSIDEIKELVVATTRTGKVVRLEDVADVFMGQEDLDEIVKINGVKGMYVMVQKQTGSNSIQVADNVLKKIKDIEKSLPSGVELNVLYDRTDLIRSSISQVLNSLILGMLLAMLVIFLFLRNIKSTIIIVLSIPISLLITVMSMYFAGLTLNLLTLTGLILGLGMIVDSSIVILENIYRYREKGAKLKSSAILGAGEMTSAIIGGTLTTVCIFLPLVLFNKDLKIVGVFTKDLAFTIIISILSSLFVALTLVPVLSSKYLKLYSSKQKPLKNKFLIAVNNKFDMINSKMENGYKRSLKLALNNKLFVILTISILLIISIFALSSLGLDILPSSSDDMVEVSITMPAGTRVEKTAEVVNSLEKVIEREIVGYKDILVGVGVAKSFFGEGSENTGEIIIHLPKANEAKVYDNSFVVKRKLRKYFKNYPEAIIKFDTGGNRGGGSGRAVDIQVRCDDLEKARNLGVEIVELLKNKVPEALEPELDMKEGVPQVELFIDRQKAYALGVDVYSAGSEITACVNGVRAGYYRVAGDEYDIWLVFRDEDRSDIIDLDRITVSNNKGQKIPVSNFAKVKITEGPVEIKRLDKTRLVTVTADKNKNISTTEIQELISKAIENNITLDDDVIISYGGDFKDMQEMMVTLIAVVIIALLLVFGVMASQFEDFKDPFIIFITMFTLLIGVAWVYILTGNNLSMFSIVGIVMLIGITVNTGIVLVDYTNLLRERGYSIFDACVEAGKSRLRPILMTTLTTILGMLPLALSSGEGAALVKPIGLTVIGGLSVNTIMTLYLVPVLYASFNRKHKGDRVKKRNKKLIEGVEDEEIRNNL